MTTPAQLSAPSRLPDSLPPSRLRRPTRLPAQGRRVLVLTTTPGPRPPCTPRLGRGISVAGWCPLDTPAALEATLDVTQVDLLVVLLSEHAPPDLRDRILGLHAWGLPVRILPWTPPQRGADRESEQYAAPLTPSAAWIKRVFDVLLGGLILLLALPVMALVALVIRWDSPGPALFRQRRIGQHSRPFLMYKFRTMHHQTEQAEAGIRSAPGPEFKLPDDPRITRVGRFLRRSSLDELPQLVNVLRGEMSLVGPRPELPAKVGRYETWQLAILAVPPGMTGWWQIQGRSNRPLDQKMEDDLYYLHHYSLALDLRILAGTILPVIRGTGAY